ncbi:hypothetical protein [Halovivax cerinus]|uniref:Uncharacterized protein n=1 Tax=Halovivax cerinus TaxID=1487865 RepID=A0ABD5NSQ8_9EURY|nr:hypothetical protein [Halovivax cerinus]
MVGTEPSPDGADGARHVGVAVFAILVVLFALVEGTRPLAFALLWIAAPVVAFGSLLQVIRGSVTLRSGRGLIFSMWCAAVVTVTMPLGALVVERRLGEALTFLGFFAALVAIGFARLSVSESHDERGRDVPPPIDPDAPAPTPSDAPTEES